MPHLIGFSTGALALGDYQTGLRILRERRIPVVEISALRDRELPPLVAALDRLSLSGFDYVSFHAPSSLSELSETAMVQLLRQVLPRRWPIIVHPDVIQNRALWQGFGSCLCLENMDKRKPIGRTVDELQPFFDAFPEATFCFDIGHARQIDPTMTEATLLLRRFRPRLRQIHMSEVTSSSKHAPISYTALTSFQKLAPSIPAQTPIILEMVIPEDRIDQQIDLAASILETPTLA